MSKHSDSNLYQHFSIYLNHLFLAVFISCVTPQIYYQIFLFQYLFLEEDRNFIFFPGQFIVLYWLKISWNFYANEMMWWFIEKLKMQGVFTSNIGFLNSHQISPKWTIHIVLCKLRSNIGFQFHIYYLTQEY